MFIAFAYTLYSRIPLEVDILRDRGKLYAETSNGMIENTYTLKLANKEQIDHQFSIKVSGLEGMKYMGDEVVMIKSGELLDLPVRITIPAKYLSKANNNILFEVEALDNPSISIKEENRFIGPAPKR
ncbi:MAG: polyferredoxin [Neptuniibacter pectenicola]|jgi:polyferredoxin